MKLKWLLTLILASSLISSCGEKEKIKSLSQLTCDSSREGRTQEELTAIGEACFRKGSFVKSSGKEW